MFLMLLEFTDISLTQVLEGKPTALSSDDRGRIMEEAGCYEPEQRTAV